MQLSPVQEIYSTQSFGARRTAEGTATGAAVESVSASGGSESGSDPDRQKAVLKR